MACWLGCLPAPPLSIVKETASAQCSSSGELDRGSVHVLGRGADSPSDQPVFSNNAPQHPPLPTVRCRLATAGLKEISCTRELLLFNSLNNEKKLPLCLYREHGPSLEEWITDTSGWLLRTYHWSTERRCCQMAEIWKNRTSTQLKFNIKSIKGQNMQAFAFLLQKIPITSFKVHREEFEPFFSFQKQP